MELTALYYPYSRAINSSTLKKAALLFDALYFLDSAPWFVRTAITNEKLTDRSGAAGAEQLEKDYALLEAEGLVRTMDAAQIVQEHDELLTANIMSDVTDNEFCRLAIGYSVDTWAILRDRIPRSLLDALYPGAGTFSEAISLQALINARGNRDRIANDRVRKFTEFRWEGLTDDEAMRIFFGRRGYRYVIGGNPHIELPAYDFPFLQASSLRVNECLVAAALNGYTPYTDSAVHDSMLRLKIDRALISIDTQPELKRQLSVDVPLRFPRQSLALEVLDYVIPEDALNRIEIRELLVYRSRNRKLFVRFHVYLEALAAEIGDVAPGADYEKRVHRVVSSKAIPELVKTRDNLISSFEDAFGGILISSGVAVGSTITATVFGGLDLWQVLFAGALAEGTVLATKAPAELFKVWKDKRSSSRSPMAYIAGLQPKGL